MSLDLCLDIHRKYFSAEPKVAVFAPGRINLIGEHTDYNDGFVMPAAIDKGIWVTGRIIDGESRMISSTAGPGKSFEACTIVPGEGSGWTKYAAGMAWVLREKYGKMPNVECAVYSNLPMGSGVSSSAAMEMAFGRVWESLAEFKIEASDLALLGQKCENVFIGVNCGIMDQMASACGRANHAVSIDTRSLAIDYAPVSDEYALLLLDTKKPRSLTTSVYNDRVRECQTAAEAMGVKKLRDATLDDLHACKSKLDKVSYRRARHVITEDARTTEFKNVLAANDTNGIFALMKGSHESLREDYEVSCSELDAMAESAWLSPGVVGARMTGAGFGGACVALVKSTEVKAFSEQCLKGYEQKTGKSGEILVCTIADGARKINFKPH